MKLAYECMDLIKQLAIEGNPNSVSDAGVAALAARSAVLGAFLNVRINLSGLEDESFKNEILNQAVTLRDNALIAENEILEIVNQKI